MFQRRLLGISVLVLSSSLLAAQPPSVEFWVWFETYSDEQGEVFDPIALVELVLVAEAQPEWVEEEVDPNEKIDDSGCSAAVQSATCRPRKD